MKLLDLIKKHVLIFYAAAILLGFIFHPFSIKLEPVIPYLVFLIIYFSTFKIEFKEFIASFKNLKDHLIIIILNFVLLPLILMWASYVVFPDNRYITVGIVFIFIMPTATTNVLYSNLLEGDTSFVLASLLITSLLSPIITPLMFYILSGSIIKVDFIAIFVKMILIVVAPFMLSLFTKKLKFHYKIKNYADSFASISFVIVNFIAASIIYYSGILNNLNELITLTIFLTVSFLLLFFAIFLIARKLSGRKYGVSLALLASRKNTSLGVAIATGILDPIVVVVLLLYQYIMDMLGLAIKKFVK